MRILAISTLFPTPNMPNHGVFVYNRLNAMANEGAEVVVINPLPWSPAHRLFSKYDGIKKTPEFRKCGALDIYHPRYFSLPGVMKDIEAGTALKSIMSISDSLIERYGKFDRIDVHWTYPDLPAALALSKKWGVPCSLTLRGMEAFYQNEPDKREAKIADAISQVDHVISLSKEMADHAHSIAGTGNRTTIIRNGVNTERFQYIAMEVARAKLNLPSDRTILLGVGSLIKRKGFHHIVNALCKLSKSYPDKNFHYHILGSTGLEGDFESELRKLAIDLGIGECVHFEGSIPNGDLPYWYNAADLFCLSSFGEGSPNVLTEALSCGCPAVASNVGSVMEIMNSEDNLGTVVDSQERSSDDNAGKCWADAINLTVDFDKREQRSIDMGKYTWQWCAKKSLSVVSGLGNK
jgi:teichuronic acid biosynthesis glycosyltransferase TuaC